MEQSHAGGVVSSVLQSFKSFKYYRICLLFSDIGYYSAHNDGLWINGYRSLKDPKKIQVANIQTDPPIEKPG
jgi:hypothetical protein